LEANRNRRLSPLDKSFEQIADSIERKNYAMPSVTFEDNSVIAREERKTKALKKFEDFDRIYFPPEFHTQGHHKPGVLHSTILQKTLFPGVFWFGAFRNLAKSAYLKKIRIWHLLSGRASIGAIAGETLKKSSKFVRSIEAILRENKRIANDFDIKIEVMNEDMLSFTCNTNKGICYYLPYSLDANARGDNVGIDRPDFMDFDDPETDRNNHSYENTEKRKKKILEAYRSCKTNANMIILGNNIDPKCLYNRLKTAQEKGEESGVFTIMSFPAWSNERTETTPYLGSVWQGKYKAKSEKEMRQLMKVHDDVEWSIAQNDPIAKTGHIFPRELQKTYKHSELPNDAVGVTYCDLNLSLKGKGDTTAMAGLLYSPKENRYFVYKPRCRSYSSSHELLSDYVKLFDSRIRLMGMDGHVNQESTWTNNIRNYTIMSGLPYPPIVFCRYNADIQASQLEAIYKQGLLYFPEDFVESEEGKEAMDQFHGFVTKKDNKKDDFPDDLICCLSLALDRSMFIASAKGTNNFKVIEVGFGGGF